MGSMERAGGGRHAGEYVANIKLDTSTTLGTYGSWVELIASSTIDYDSLAIQLQYPDGERLEVDIGIGGSGSEVVVIKEIPMEEITTNYRGAMYNFPIHIPAGTRISARCRSIGENVARYTYIDFYPTTNGFQGPSGFQIADKIGKASVVASNTNGTYGSYKEITPSATNTYQSLLMCFDNLGQGLTADRLFYLDIALGGSGSEVNVVESIILVINRGDDNIIGLCSPIIKITVPEGERISVRSRAYGASGERSKGVTVYGFR